MLSQFTYNAVNTKIRVMFSRLLSEEDYRELAGKKSVTDITGYLKKSTSYHSLLADVNENLVHRGDLEKLLKKSLISDYFKLFKFINYRPKEFLKAAFLRYEIEDLKILLRVLNTEQNNELVRDSLVFLKKYNTIDLNKLAQSRNIPEFIENLRGSMYYKVLEPFLAGVEHQNLFDLEMALDLHFFMTILKRRDNLLEGRDRISVSDSFGTEIDILNILWIFRCKKLFHLSKEVTLNHIIPHHYRLTKEQLLQLAESRDTDDFKSRVSKTKYGSLFQGAEEQWETSYLNYTCRLYKKHLRTDYNHFGAVIAYLHLKEIDIRNIISIIEGVRYSLPKEEVKKFIITGSKR